MYLILLFVNLFSLQLFNGVDIVVDSGALELSISNLQEGDGQILVSIYEEKSPFPDKPEKVYKIDKSEEKNKTIIYSIDNFRLAHKYAIVVLDDENKNENMDYNMVGVPKEGYGFSNNAKPKFLTPPTFEDCSFTLNQSENLISIKMKYW